MLYVVYVLKSLQWIFYLKLWGICFQIKLFTLLCVVYELINKFTEFIVLYCSLFLSAKMLAEVCESLSRGSAILRWQRYTSRTLFTRTAQYYAANITRWQGSIFSLMLYVLQFKYVFNFCCLIFWDAQFTIVVKKIIVSVPYFTSNRFGRMLLSYIL